MKKFEKDFRTWYLKQDYCTLAIGEYGEEHVYRGFVALDFQFKWGVYLAFFDSVGMHLFVDLLYDTVREKQRWYFVVSNSKDQHISELIRDNRGWIDNRQEAQEEAVEKAIEIYNGV